MPDIATDSNLRFPNQAGFTFLEVTIALAIIAIVLLSVYRLHSQTILMNIRSRFDTIAPLLATQKLSEVEIDTNRSGSTSGNFGERFSGYEWQVTVSDVAVESLGSMSQEMRRIDVQVKFQKENNTYQLRAYRLKNAE